jgi:OOP family OmpA-OmpF porin
MNVLKSAVGVVLAALCGVASAQSAEGYVGGSLGFGHFNSGCKADANTSCDDGASGWKIYGGAYISEHFSLELNYFNFGKYGYTESGAKLENSIKAFGVGLAYQGKVATNLSLIGRLGIANVMSQGTASGNAGSLATSNSTGNPYAGVGVAYSVTPQIKVQGSFDFTQAEIIGISGNVSLLSAGVSYEF